VDLLIVLGSLVFLMLVAYRGYSVILFAPIAALGAVLLTDPSLVPPMFSGVFMEKMVGFIKSYFPVFMLGAVFGKVIELSGFSKSIVSAVIGILGKERAVLSIVRRHGPPRYSAWSAVPSFSLSACSISKAAGGLRRPGGKATAQT
jgi:H+/gluconate symporter-like permease